MKLDAPAFDAFGTRLGPLGIGAGRGSSWFDRGAPIARRWRSKLPEYPWPRALIECPAVIGAKSSGFAVFRIIRRARRRIGSACRPTACSDHSELYLPDRKIWNDSGERGARVRAVIMSAPPIYDFP